MESLHNKIMNLKEKKSAGSFDGWPIYKGYIEGYEEAKNEFYEISKEYDKVINDLLYEIDNTANTLRSALGLGLTYCGQTDAIKNLDILSYKVKNGK